MSKKNSSFYGKINEETEKSFTLISTKNDYIFGEVFVESKTDDNIQSTFVFNSPQHDNFDNTVYRIYETVKRFKVTVLNLFQ